MDGLVFGPRPAVLVSRCLLGIPCRYHGSETVMGRHIGRPALIARLRKKYELLDVCPEVDAGLPTPRPPIILMPGPGHLRGEGHHRTAPPDRLPDPRPGPGPDTASPRTYSRPPPPVIPPSASVGSSSENPASRSSASEESPFSKARAQLLEKRVLRSYTVNRVRQKEEDLCPDQDGPALRHLQAHAAPRRRGDQLSAPQGLGRGRGSRREAGHHHPGRPPATDCLGRAGRDHHGRHDRSSGERSVEGAGSSSSVRPSPGRRRGMHDPLQGSQGAVTSRLLCPPILLANHTLADYP